MPDLAYHPAAFPSNPPSDCDAPAAILTADRNAFDQLARTKVHWNRPGWSDETRIVYWLLTFDEDPALAKSAADIQSALAPLDYDLIDAVDLHLTLTRAGSRDQLTDSEIDTLASVAVGRLGPAFELTAHPLAGSAGAVRYSVTPWTPVVALHATLSALHHELGLPGGKSTERFRPHLGVAYSRGERAAQPVIDTVASLRALPPVDLTIAHVDLVELRREPGRYAWDLLHRVPLTQAEPTEG
ncbi:2'-5' RNA ligase family protein [Peterkaempfera bronchialis]|nr:2'-5' RNA ligase family protein [Peterkaempfera bronchialis]